MTIDDAVDLLTAAAMFDRRTVGKADAIAWHAVVGDLPIDDALAAVRAHYAEGTDWLMPAHVRQRVKAVRRDRIERQVAPAPPADATDHPARYRQALAAAIASIADGRQLRRAIAPSPPPPPGTGLPADHLAALKARLPRARPVTPKPSLQELAARQAAESRRERGGAGAPGGPRDLPPVPGESS